MAAKTKSVKDVAAQIYAGKVNVSAAVDVIKGSALTRSLAPHMPFDADEMIFQSMNDSDGPEPNDVLYLDTLRSSGTITSQEFEQLVDALNVNNAAPDGD